jgi:hypothetical protein
MNACASAKFGFVVRFSGFGKHRGQEIRARQFCKFRAWLGSRRSSKYVLRVPCSHGASPFVLAVR